MFLFPNYKRNCSKTQQKNRDCQLGLCQNPPDPLHHGTGRVALVKRRGGKGRERKGGEPSDTQFMSASQHTGVSNTAWWCDSYGASYFCSRESVFFGGLKAVMVSNDPGLNLVFFSLPRWVGFPACDSVYSFVTWTSNWFL